MVKTKKNNIEYEEAQPYQKYRRKKGWTNTIKSLVPLFFSLAVLSSGLSIMTQSLKSSGILEDDSYSRVGKPNTVMVGRGN